jgi:hypothetical protein
MKMIRHQAERMNLPASLPAGLAQRIHKTLPVLITLEDWFRGDLRDS